MQPTTIRIGNAEVPRIGLGTNRLAHTDANVAFIGEAAAAGVRMIDTAHLYVRGESESTIGATLADLPDDVIVATKGGFNDSSPETLVAEVEESLRRLGTDCIDLYYLHKPHGNVALEKSVEALARERDRGRIRDIGVSNVDVGQLKRAGSVTAIAAVQNHYNLQHREHEEVLEYCTSEGIPFVPFFPLRDRKPEAAAIARRLGVTESQVTLAWLLRRSPVMLPIPGTLSIEHLRDNLAALDLDLSDADMAALN